MGEDFGVVESFPIHDTGTSRAQEVFPDKRHRDSRAEEQVTEGLVPYEIGQQSRAARTRPGV